MNCIIKSVACILLLVLGLQSVNADDKLDQMLDKLYKTNQDAKPSAQGQVSNEAIKINSYIPSDVFKHARQNVVIVFTQKMMGSGFAVTEDGYIITNRHVISEDNKIAQKVAVIHPDWGKSYCTASIVKVSKNRDLALLKIEHRFPEFLKIDASDIPVGAKVYSLGNPGSGVEGVDPILELTFTEGIISGKNRTVGGNPCLQTTATINHGNSGGPLLDENCKVIGVNAFGLSNMENTFFAINIDEAIKEFGDTIQKK